MSWKKFDISADSNFVVLMVVLSSAAAVVIAVFTLFEMKAQRELASKPVLVLKGGDYKLAPDYDYKYSVQCDSLDWVNHWHELDQAFEPIELYNVGNGSAVQVEVEWIFEWAEYFDSLKDSLNLDTTFIEIEDQTESIIRVDYKCSSDTKSRKRSYGVNNKKLTYSHILPHANGNSGLSLSYPRELIHLEWNMLKYILRKDVYEVSRAPRFDLIFKCKYQSVNGESYLLEEPVRSQLEPNWLNWNSGMINMSDTVSHSLKLMRYD